MPIWNRQHGQCNFLLKWFVRMSLCTYGSQSLACHSISTVSVQCDTACYLPTPGKHPAPVTSIMTCLLSCVTGHFVCGGGG